jgi:pimeloyl-ACP methyl ester carboxylesterase
MNTNDLLASWSTMSLEEIEARLEAGTDDDVAEQFFGAEEMAEMQALSRGPVARGLREAVVLLPGVMGSLLTSIRGVTTLLWINPLLFLKGNSAYLELNEAGTHDRVPAIDTAPLGLEKMVYTKIGLALRRQTDLFEFPYDWRRPIAWNAAHLHDCLERWAGKDRDRKFTLVGHSMGGLVSRAYLACYPEASQRRVKHVIMHGTPHFGATGAVANLIHGNSMMALASKLNKKNVTRRLLLNMPSIYELVPAPPALFPSHRPYPANWDLYRAEEWHLEGLRQDYLNDGIKFYKLLADSDPQLQITQIAGCNLNTIVDMRRSSGPDGKPVFRTIGKAEGPDAGDGTVPLWSAVLPGANMHYVEEVHRDLPKNKHVIRATLDLIHGRKPKLATSIPTSRGVVERDVAPEVDAEALRERIEAGTATEKDLEQLYFAF